MKKILFSFIAVAMSIAVYSQTIVPEGPVYGTWTLNGSPYLITGTINVPDGSTLVIEPGVEIEFQESYFCWINGCILAQGNETDTILFTAADPDVGFRGIRFYYTNSDNDTSRFEYCIFEYGNAHGNYPDNCGGALTAMEFSKIVVDHCLFRNNQAIEYSPFPGISCAGAIALWTSSMVIRNSSFIDNTANAGGAVVIYLESNPIIENNIFTGNQAINLGYAEGYGGAIYCIVNSDPIISCNIFNENYAHNGGGGFACISQCAPTIHHNLFYDNTAGWGGAIEVQDTCQVTITNNTIANNYASNWGGGVHLWTDCNVEIRNTILWENAPTQIHLQESTDTICSYYSDVMDGQSGIGGIGSIQCWVQCIDDDPLFKDAADGDYVLGWASYPVVDQTRSPCIDVGTIMTYDPDGTTVDIGAFYFDQMPETPVAQYPEEWTNTSFLADWSSCYGALGYILDVAYDEEFNNFVPGYENLHLTDTASFYNVTDLTYGMIYYYRVKACNTACTGTYSNIVFVDVISQIGEMTEKPFNIYYNDHKLVLTIWDPMNSQSSAMIYDITGHLIGNRSVSQGTTVIPLSISKQVVIVKLTLNGKAYSQKLLIR